MSNELLFFGIMILGMIAIPFAVWRGSLWRQGICFILDTPFAYLSRRIARIVQKPL